jgi:hypothetical protein
MPPRFQAEIPAACHLACYRESERAAASNRDRIECLGGACLSSTNPSPTPISSIVVRFQSILAGEHYQGEHRRSGILSWGEVWEELGTRG